MKFPKNHTPEQFLEVFNLVIKKLAEKYKFGIHDADDIKQEAFIIATDPKVLKKYDTSRPLANFLYIHLRNRLYNYKRNKYIRLEMPCTRCPLSAFIKPDRCSAYTDRLDCELYSGWIDRNNKKRNLANALEYTQVNKDREKTMKYSDNLVSEINTGEIKRLIDKELCIDLRKYYLMMMAGVKINKKERDKVEEAITEIIRNNKYEL